MSKITKTIKKIYQATTGSKPDVVSAQAQRGNSVHKTELIEPVIKELGCKSVFDLGCNSGEITRMLGKDLFAVGVDQFLDFRGFENAHRGACLGEMSFDEEAVEKLPVFDSMLLLSVHHQWANKIGDEYAREMVKNLFTKVNHVLFMEFAALTTKYGNDDSIFTNNDEATVTQYAQRWLVETLGDAEFRYLGSSPHRPGALAHYIEEPRRFMFACIKPQ